MTMLLQKGWNIAIHMVGLDGSVFSCPIPNWKGRPGLVERILQMYEKHGLTMGARCKTCRHLERYEPPRYKDGLGYDAEGFTVPKEIHVDGGATFPKCRAFSKENGRSTDWRLNWPACGAWNRKELEVLVGGVRTQWYRGELGDVPLDVAITDALWKKMVPVTTVYDRSGQIVSHLSTDKPRALICTDTPAPTLEEDAVKLARKLRRMWPVNANGDLAFLAEILADADRIIEEADDGQV